jgi:hypothetical protein
MRGAILPLLHYAFMAWCSVTQQKHWDKFTFTFQPLTTEPSSFYVEIVIEKLKGYKLSGTDQIPAELIQAGGNTAPY